MTPVPRAMGAERFSGVVEPACGVARVPLERPDDSDRNERKGDRSWLIRLL